MKAKSFVCGLFIVLLFGHSVSSAAPTKNETEGCPNYLGLRVGYGFSLVGEKELFNGRSSRYDQYGNQRIAFDLRGCINLMSSHGDGLCLALPFNLDISFRYNDKRGIKRRHSEILLDTGPQVGMNLGGITPFVNAGPTLSLSYLKYEKEDYLSWLYGVNMAAGGRLNLETIFAQLKLQYRFLWGTERPLDEATKEYLKDVSERRQTLGVVGNVGFQPGGPFYLEAGVKFEKSKDRFKHNWKTDRGWWYGEKRSEWTKWSKWSTGELRIFLGAGIMI
ncbi:MAG: hypothetical protein ACE5KJ_01520 [Candidatus Zixiibacteriota bacterium]